MAEFNVLRDRPVFICGHPKSGTSLLRNLLDSHPQLVVYPEETSFFRRYWPKARHKTFDEKLALARRWLIHIFEWNQADPPEHQAGFPDRDYSDVDFEAVAAAMRQLVGETHRHDGDLLAAAVLAFGQVTGQVMPQTCRWVEKTPYNEYFMEQIFEWWPQARVLHVVRDPRDNYASYSRKHRDWTPEFFAGNWLASTLAGQHNQDTYGPDRCLLLRFEDLLVEPEETLGKICAFLEIDDHPSLRVPSRLGDVWEGNSMFREAYSQIDTAPIGRWREALTTTEAGIIQAACKPGMDALGYAAEGKTPLAAQVRYRLWRLRRALRLRKSERELRNPG